MLRPGSLCIRTRLSCQYENADAAMMSKSWQASRATWLSAQSVRILINGNIDYAVLPLALCGAGVRHASC
jgi:hypothetical protein